MIMRSIRSFSFSFKDTHMGKTPSSKTESLKKSMNMYISAIGILDQEILILKLNFQKMK